MRIGLAYLKWVWYTATSNAYLDVNFSIMTALFEQQFILWLNASRPDASLIGEKAYALAMAKACLSSEAQVEDGFIITTQAFDAIMKNKELRGCIKKSLKQLDISKPNTANTVARIIKKKIMTQSFPEELNTRLSDAYKTYTTQHKGIALVLRPSVYGYMKESPGHDVHGYVLNIRSEKMFARAIRLCVASLFSSAALHYRELHGIDHRAVKMALLVQHMFVGARAVSGIINTTARNRTLSIEAAYGLPLYRKKQSVEPDLYTFFKPSLAHHKVALIRKVLGTKRLKMTVSATQVKDSAVSRRDQTRFALTDAEAHALSQVGEYLEQKLGQPLCIEWVLDEKHKISIFDIHLLPAERKQDFAVETYELKRTGDLILKGFALGSKVVHGQIYVVQNKRTASVPERAIVMVRNMGDVSPLILKHAAALVTQEKGADAYAARLARELGIPVILEAKDAFTLLKTGDKVTLECNGVHGHIYRGYLPFEVVRKNTNASAKTRTGIFMSIDDTRNASMLSSVPADGVATIEQDSIIQNYLGAHPLVLVDTYKITQTSIKHKIARLTRGYAGRSDYAITKLAEGIAEVASAFYPQPVQLRMSDKTEQNAGLLGGSLFAKYKDGEQGASRYYSKWYRPAFALECKAIKKAREDWGLENIEVLIPYCRTPEEAKKVLEAMADAGLVQGEQGLKIHVCCDIPSNLILAGEYARLFDGLSLGSYTNKENEHAGYDNPVIRQMLREVIAIAHKNARTVSFLHEHPLNEDGLIEFLIRQKIDRISVEAHALVAARERVSYIEQTVGKTGHTTSGKFLSLVLGCAVLATGLINVGAGCASSPSYSVQTQDITPAQIREQIVQDVSAKKAVELEQTRSVLKISSFARLELEYPSTWNINYWSDGITMHSPTHPEEYISIFRQLIPHKISYNTTTIAGIASFSQSVPLATGERTIEIYELPTSAGVVEINGYSPVLKDIIASIKISNDQSKTKINPLLNHWDIRDKRICERMAVFARPSNEQGVCSLYANPCDVPAGWQVCGAVD